MTEPRPSVDARTVTVRVPIAIRRRGGRKLVLAPDDAEVTAAPVTRHVDNAMVKAVARAFRWREMLEDGTHATIAETPSPLLTSSQLPTATYPLHKENRFFISAG
jgi:hypothetical protein